MFFQFSLYQFSVLCFAQGKANGKVGYFPAKYVEKINPGEKVLEVVQGLEISEGDLGVKLLKDQVWSNSFYYIQVWFAGILKRGTE